MASISDYEERYFEDEEGIIHDDIELRIEYECLKRDGETEAETFEDYIINCTSKNGTLTEITEAAQ